MQFDSIVGRNYRLEGLYKWLSFELPGIVLFGLSFFYNIAFIAFLIAAVIFTPYMLYVLIQEKRYGWVIFFALFVVVPGVVIHYLFSGYSTYSFSILGGSQLLAGAIPMALYLFYCFLLKLSIPGMRDE